MSDVKERLQEAADLVSEAEQLGEATGPQRSLFTRLGGHVRGAGGQYKTLNDAADGAGDGSAPGASISVADGLKKGSTEIWFAHPDYTRDVRDGPDFLKNHAGEKSNSPAGVVPSLPTAKTLSRTHVLLGKIKETNPDRIYEMMQAPNWSPGGKARGLIRAKGLHHTSMSVGDVIKVGGKLLMVDRHGFYSL